jgi:hypothetical protein
VHTPPAARLSTPPRRPSPTTHAGGNSASATGESSGRPIIFPYIDLNIQTLQQNGVISGARGPAGGAAGGAARGARRDLRCRAGEPGARCLCCTQISTSLPDGSACPHRPPLDARPAGSTAVTPGRVTAPALRGGLTPAAPASLAALGLGVSAGGAPVPAAPVPAAAAAGAANPAAAGAQGAPLTSAQARAEAFKAQALEIFRMFRERDVGKERFDEVRACVASVRPGRGRSSCVCWRLGSSCLGRPTLPAAGPPRAPARPPTHPPPAANFPP